MEIGIEFNKEQMQELQTLARDFPKAATSAARSAANAALRVVQRNVVKVLSVNMGIKRKEFTTPHSWGVRQSGRRTTKAVEMVKATARRPEARLLISGKRIPLVWFGARPTAIKVVAKKRWVRAQIGSGPDARWYTFKRRGSGVSYKIGREGRRKLKEAFMGRGRSGKAETAADAASGHLGVFVRAKPPGSDKPVKRLPIVEPRGPSVPEAAIGDPAIKAAIDGVAKLYLDTMAQKVDAILKRKHARDAGNSEHESIAETADNA